MLNPCSRIAKLVALRAALAFAFVVFASFQPGMFTMANTMAFEADGGSFAAGDVDQDAHAAHLDPSAVNEEPDGHASSSHDQKSQSEKACEVHCAPAQAVPVECPPMSRQALRCFVAAVMVAMQPGEYAELIRPPRHLV